MESRKMIQRNIFTKQKQTHRHRKQTHGYQRSMTRLYMSPCLFKLYAQNPSNLASTVCELRTSRCTAGLRKWRGTRDQIAQICWILGKAKEFHKDTYFCFIDYTRAFDCVDHNTLWKILKRWGYKTTLPPPEKPICRSRSNS